MNWVKGFALATCLAAPISAILATGAMADPAASATPAAAGDKKTPTKEMIAKCTAEANAKGLFVRSGKGEARKEFRRHCVRKAIGAE